MSNFSKQENESITDQHTRLTVLPDKYNCNQCHMSICKVDLFIHAIKYFAIHYEIALAENNHDKERR